MGFRVVNISPSFEQLGDLVRKIAELDRGNGKFASGNGSVPGFRVWPHVESVLNGRAKRINDILQEMGSGGEAWQQFLKPKFVRIREIISDAERVAGLGAQGNTHQAIARIETVVAPAMAAFRLEAGLAKLSRELAESLLSADLSAATRPKVVGLVYYSLHRGLSVAVHLLQGSGHPLACLALTAGVVWTLAVKKSG